MRGFLHLVGMGGDTAEGGRVEWEGQDAGEDDNKKLVAKLDLVSHRPLGVSGSKGKVVAGDGGAGSRAGG